MKKSFTLICLMLLATLVALAEKVTPTEALQAALPYMKSVDATLQRQARAGSAEQPVYIFSRGAGEGFVIVSGDNSLPLVLGVADSGDWDEDDMPPLLLQWVKMYEHYVDSVQRNGGAPARQARASVYPKNISPMITSHWHQTAPYNNRAPQRADGGGRAVTGCVATAAAQIAYYWRNEGVNSETQSNTKYGYWSPDAPVLASDVIPKGTKFMWELMKDSYGSFDSAASRDAAAVLCAVMGFDAELSYGASTGGYIWNEIDVFKKQIGLVGGTHIWKSDTSQGNFETICANDLALGRPILYAGYNEDWTSGHAIVMDGYRTSDNSFHFNFGWGGSGDGYYQLIDGSVNGFGYGESIVYGIYSPNMDRTLEVTPVEETFYQYLPNHLNVKVYNGSSMALKGVYLFASATNSIPATYTLADAIASHPGYMSGGAEWETTAVYQPTAYNTASGIYFLLTDENLSVLYCTKKGLPVNLTRCNLTLNRMQIGDGVASSESFNYGGEEVTRTVYRVGNNSDVHVDARLTNTGTLRQRPTVCLPSAEAIIYRVEADGSVTKVNNISADNGLFVANEEKLIGYDFAGLEKDVLYKASLAPVIFNGNNPTSTKLLYEASEDTVAFFRLVGSDMNVEVEGRHATVSGTGYSPYAYRQLMANEEIASVDVSGYTGGFPADAPAPANPNVVFYAASEAQMSGNNVVVNGVCNELVLQVGHNFDPATSFTATRATVVGESVLCTNDSYYWNTLVLPFEMTVPAGVLARRFTGPTATTESSCPTFYAGTPYVYLTLDNIDFTAENVSVKSLADMPASTGYMNFIGTFVNFSADGTSQAVTTGTAMSFPAAGTTVKALTAYRTVECSLANMAGAVRVENKMHNFVQGIVSAREKLELYREERSAADIADFQTAITAAEQQMTAMPSTFQEITQLYDAITAATETYVNADPTAVSVLKADNKEGAGEPVIYDINGRRLKVVPEKGFYIIDGKAYIK